MKAVLCKEYGPPDALVVEDIPTPEPGPDQVLLKVHAAAVNFPDVLIIQNKYQFSHETPFTPGSEVAGEVIQCGENVKNLKVGDRILGSSGVGGFAEQIVMDGARMLKIPDAMDFISASAFLLTYGTSHHALKDRAAIKPGETLLVLGAAGGVGLAAVELGKAMGARVIAAASTEEKLEITRQHGADDAILYSSGDLDRDQQKEFSNAIKEKTGGQGADVVYDPVGGAYAEPALRATNWEGRYLVIGFAAGDIPRIPLNLALLKGCQIVGVFWGAFVGRDPVGHAKNCEELMALYLDGKIKPHVSVTYPLEKTAQALNDMAARKVIGKIVVVPGS
ncbi:MAG: NADPH:quinone oxidoreductase family protein [Parvularculales bacterium]